MRASSPVTVAASDEVTASSTCPGASGVRPNHGWVTVTDPGTATAAVGSAPTAASRATVTNPSRRTIPQDSPLGQASPVYAVIAFDSAMPRGWREKAWSASTA
jgi:hypothetical protein